MIRALPILLLCVLTLMEYRNLAQTHAPTWDTDIVQREIEIPDGNAYCYVFQSRILGPAIERGTVNYLGIDYALAVHGFFFAVLLVTNLVVWKLTDGWMALAYATVFTWLADQRILFSWDVIDGLTMFLFAYGAFRRVRLRWMLLLFLAELLNKEYALAIAAWVILDALVSCEWFEGGFFANTFSIVWPQFFAPPYYQWGRICRALLGCLMLFGGRWWVGWLRSYLAVGEHRMDSRVAVKLGQSWAWPANVSQAKTLFAKTYVDMDFTWHNRLDELAALVILAAVVGILVYYFRQAPSCHSFNICLLAAALTASILLFACMSEMRDWIPLPPFCLLAIYEAHRRHIAG